MGRNYLIYSSYNYFTLEREVRFGVVRWGKAWYGVVRSGKVR